MEEWNWFKREVEVDSYEEPGYLVKVKRAERKKKTKEEEAKCTQIMMWRKLRERSIIYKS